VSPLTLLAVSTPIPPLRKHTEFFAGAVGENMIHVAPIQPLYAAHVSRHASKEVWVELEISMFCLIGDNISVPQSLRNGMEETEEVYVELLTRGHPAVSIITVDVAAGAVEVAVG
jgi:hypothetical protein